MTDKTSDLLLDAFSTSTDPALRVQTLSELMTVKAIPKRADDARFGAGLDRWVDLANNPDAAPQERLLAVAELIRATQQLKKRQPALIQRIQAAFQQTLPAGSM